MQMRHLVREIVSSPSRNLNKKRELTVCNYTYLDIVELNFKNRGIFLLPGCSWQLPLICTNQVLVSLEPGVEETSIHPYDHFSHMHPPRNYIPSFLPFLLLSRHVNRLSSGRTEAVPRRGLVEIPWGPAHSARIDRHARIFSHSILFVSVYRGRTLSWRGAGSRERVSRCCVSILTNRSLNAPLQGRVLVRGW